MSEPTLSHTVPGATERKGPRPLGLGSAPGIEEWAGLRVRVCEPEHAERIAALHLASWRETYRGILPDEFLDGETLPRRLRAWRLQMTLARADRLMMCAETPAQLVGFICVHAAADRDWGSRIESVHVAPGCKRRGVGLALMGQAGEWLQRGYPRLGVYVWVVERNSPALRFYERLGAHAAGRGDRCDASGGSAPNCRYAWRSPAELLRGCAHARAAGHPQD